MSPAATSSSNGVLPSSNAPRANATPAAPRIILAGNNTRILCVADIRGDYHELNRLIREHEASAVIHTGDFGFLNADSLERMHDKILHHLLQYSPLIPPATRSELLAIPATTAAGRKALISKLNSSSIHFPLSQFPLLLSGAITFPVPVFAVWGVIEDVRIVEKFRTGEYEVHNLTVIDEVSSALIETAGLKLRLFGLGGGVVLHKLFDNGEGFATIAGGQGTMWTTALQMGELIDTAQRVYDPSETRILVTSAAVTRSGLLSLLALGVKADLTVSGGLHFRYPASLNEFAVCGDFESYRQKLILGRDNFLTVYGVVKERVEGSLNEQQHVLLKKTLATVQKIPSTDDGTWTHMWHWVLSDALCGHLLLNIADGRVGAEIKSQGLNFAYRASQAQQPPSAPIAAPTAPLAQAARPTAAEIAKQNAAGVPPKPTAAAAAAAGAPTKPASSKAASSPTTSKGTPTQQPLKLASQGSETSSQPPRSARGGSTGQAIPTAPGSAKAEGKPKGRESPLPTKAASTTSSSNNNVPANQGKTPAISPIALPKEVKDTKKGLNGAEGDGAESPKNGTSTPKRFSLYIKGLPIPTSEAEIRAFFGTEGEKITTVKLVFDQNNRRQKNFCYVDFTNEADLQETLKAHPGGAIRDSTITVEPSNPHFRSNTDRGGRASRSGRGRPTRGGSGSVKELGFSRPDKADGPGKSDAPKGEAK